MAGASVCIEWCMCRYSASVALQASSNIGITSLEECVWQPGRALLVHWRQYLVTPRSMRKHVCPLHSTPPPPLPRLIRVSRVPGMSLFWGPGSLAGSCRLGFGGASDVGYG
eukprot:6128239-Pyramimonas_sp.AAC.1